MYAKVLLYISQVVQSKSTTVKETAANNLSLHNWAQDYFHCYPFPLFCKLELISVGLYSHMFV